MKYSFVLLIFLVITSCAPKFNYDVLQNAMATKDCPGSIELLKNSRQDYGSKALLIHMLDSGMVHFQCDDPKEATIFFQNADHLAQDLWTKSFSKEAAAFVTNDFILPYRGEDFERAMICMFSAFSYIKLGEFDEAMADCRRLDIILNEYNDKYEKKNVYREDALGRYISGILSEADNEFSEAYIFYHDALKAFKNYEEAYGTPTPNYLLEDLLRVSVPADRKSEALALVPNNRKISVMNHKSARSLGKIILVHMNGMAPVKIENKFSVVTATGPISIAFPVYTANPPACRSSRMILKSPSHSCEVETELFEDINRIAVKDLEDRKFRITAKAIARAVAKQALVQASSKEMEKHYGAMAGLVANIAGNVAASALERADTRSWRTLPGEIYIARSFVPQGEYQIIVEMCDGFRKELSTVSVKAGETKFIFCDTIY